ncbi:uncharacterized protein [Linepithema humile]|nr:PREDICTED: uncharacterized protein LOC105672771 isoform X1 [Linepithema humile]
MGNYASKLFHNENQKGSNEIRITQQVIIQDNSMCTSILPERKVLIDPRSISAGITRTPIEVKCTPVGVIKKAPSAIPKYLQKKQFLETDIDVVMPPLTPKKHSPKLTDICQSSESDKSQNYSTPDVSVLKNSKPIQTSIERYQILGLDPRSPAADFDRTPILIPKSFASMKTRSQENLSRRGSYEMDIYNPRNSYQNINTSFSIPEIQSLSDVTSEGLEGWKKLDTEKPNDSHISNLCQANSYSSTSESEKEVTVVKNPKFENAKEKPLTSEQTIVNNEKEDEDDADKLDDCKDIDHSTKIIQINDNKIKVWHDSEENVSDKQQEKDFVEKLLQRKTSLREDVIITFDECMTNTSLFKTTKVKGDCQTKEDAEGKKKKSIKVDVKSVSCERKTFTPENKHETLKNRTPLGNRSNDGQIQKIPSKSPQLQLLRNKTASTRIEQENTPPCKKYNAKGKCEIQWDPNSTVFI